LRQLIMTAYAVATDRVVGPGWLDTERYSVAATLPPNTTETQFQAMLTALLSERFGLALHHETRQLSGYVLSVDAAGPKLRLAEEDNSERPPAGSRPPPLAQDSAGFLQLAPGMHEAERFNNGTMRGTYRGISMAEFAHSLGSLVSSATGGNMLDPPVRVVDNTGLTGKWDFTLEFGASPRPFMPGMAPVEAAGPTLFAALKNQLGLRLVGGKEPIDVLVVDHADRVPTPN
jgi:uncharacterized protein (TIGR03435 family)